MKPIRITLHARLRCQARGATEEEVLRAIREGIPEAAKKNRAMYRMNIEFNEEWMGEKFAVKQVAPVVAEQVDELVVVTVYVFYF